MTIPNQDYVYESLVRKNYFPNQKTEREELPPIFSTQGLDKGTRLSLEQIEMRKGGYDQIVYKSTRFNNVPRIMSIPHPLPYIQLVDCIASNWNDLKYTAQNKVSRIKPQVHPDGRLIIMDYESTLTKTRRVSKTSFGKRFAVRC